MIIGLSLGWSWKGGVRSPQKLILSYLIIYNKTLSLDKYQNQMMKVPSMILY